MSADQQERELPYELVSVSEPRGRAREWMVPLWDAINAWADAGHFGKMRHAAEVSRAVERAMRMAMVAALRSTPPEPVATRLTDPVRAARVWLFNRERAGYRDHMPDRHVRNLLDALGADRYDGVAFNDGLGLETPFKSPPPQQEPVAWLIWSIDWEAWYREGGNGYTDKVDLAGRFTTEDAARRTGFHHRVGHEQSRDKPADVAVRASSVLPALIRAPDTEVEDV